MEQVKHTTLQNSPALSSDDITGKILHFLGRATSELGTSLNWDETLNQLCLVITPDLADHCSVWWFDGSGELIEKKTTYVNHPFADSIQTEIKYVMTAGTARMKNGEDMTSGYFLTVPMRHKNKIAGMISLFNYSRPFNQVDLVIAEELAHRSATVLDHARLYGELKTTQEHLQKMRQTAEIANQTKSLFLANMSHEIRTPLTAILGFLDLILSGTEQNAAQKQDLADRVRANSAHLLRLIDQVLDLSKIESGKFELQRERVNLVHLLKDVHDTLILQATHKQNTLKFEVANPIPVEIHTDPTRLKQILINIIGNAIKFTDRGSITVRIGYRPTDSKLSIVVRDTGIGLTKEQIQRIFNPFIQGDSTHAKRFGGTGLGLSLSKKFAQHMNGDLVLLESVSEKGTSFEITVDAGCEDKSEMTETLWESTQKTKDTAVSLEHKHILSGAKILLAEDSPDNQLVINFILEKAGALVDTASDGAQALQMAMSKTYDVILLDIEIPTLNGHVVCQKLRAEGYKNPIIALTAHALKKERDESLQAGCDDHLTKPIDKNLLLATVQFYIEKHQNTVVTH